MPAEIDSMAFYGEVPWHRLGTKLDRPATAAEAIAAAGLGWDVQLQPLYTGVDRDIRIKDRFAVCRSDRIAQPDGGQLGVVGRDYTPLQNNEAFSFLDPLVGEDAAIYHTAGSLKAGRRIWMLAKLPGEIRVIGDDITEKYLLLSNSHDGSSSVRIGLTPIRVVCQNTLTLALSSMAGLTIRHEAQVVHKVRQAHQILGLVNESFNHAGLAMQQMARTSMTSSRLKTYFNDVFDLPVDLAPIQPRVERRLNRLNQLFEDGIGQDMPGVGGTVWAALNAVTQYVDRDLCAPRNKEPLNSIWFGDGARIKQRAYDHAARLTQFSSN